MNRTVLALLLLVCATLVAYAAERQVAFDSAGKVLTITSELAAQLRVFQDVPDFREARLFLEGDSLFTLELLSGPADSVLRERRPLAVAEVAALRKNVDERIHSCAPELYLDQTGRTKLLVNSTVLGIFWYGPAVPYLLDLQDGASATGVYLLTAGGSFFVPWMATERSNVTRASASLATYGLTRGALFTYQLASVVRGEQTEDRGVVGLVVIGGAAAGFGGFALGARENMTDGRAGLIGTGGDFGDAFGMAVGALATDTDDDEAEWRSIAGWGLLGATGGMLIENSLALNYPYTRGDSYIIRGAGYLGVYLPLAFMGAADVEGEDALLTVGILGGVTGLSAGHLLARGQAYSVAAGQQTIIAALAGRLAGLGIATIARGDGEDNAGLQIGAALGAAGGYALAAYQHRRIATLLPRALDTAQLQPALIANRQHGVVPGFRLHIGW